MIISTEYLCVPYDKEKLRRLIEQGHEYYYSDAYNGVDVYEAIAEYLIMKGTCVMGGADDGGEYV